MVRKSITALVIIIGAIFALTTIHPAPHATPISQTHSHTLPACATETGEGQALCMWDASEQGNRMGTDVVAGDCSTGTVLTVDASTACMALWARPNGKALVWECLNIEYEARSNNEYRIELNANGWTITECFNAMMG